MLKGTRNVTANVPVPYSLGPIYYRNSFERRTTPYYYVSGVAQNTGTFNIDPCFYNPQRLSSTGVNYSFCNIQQTNVRSGLYSVKANGYTTSATNSYYYYKIADTKIGIKANMQLSFWKYTENDLGRYASVDLLLKNHLPLRDVSGYVDQTGNGMHPGNGHGTVGNGWENFTCQIGKGELVGDTITGIIIAYDHPSSSGMYTAYFDDIILEDTGESLNDIFENTDINRKMSAYNGKIYTQGFPANSELSIYNTLGEVIKRYSSLKSIINPNLTDGIYIVKVKYQHRIYTQKIILNNH